MTQSPIALPFLQASRGAGKRSTPALLVAAAALAIAVPSSTALAQKYLILGAAEATVLLPIREALLDTGLVAQVDVRHIPRPAGTAGGTLPTPTLAELLQYDAVMVFSNASFENGFAMGEVLADYVDAGGGVVCAMYVTGTTVVNRSLTGRWQSEGYDIIPQRSGNLTTATTLGTVHLPQHALWSGLTGFSVASSPARSVTTAVEPHGIRIADWADGTALVATSSTFPKRVDVNAYPNMLRAHADGTRLMANALIVAATGGGTTPGACCFDDGTCQILSGFECVTTGGLFRGENTDCLTACEQPAACCMPSGSCTMLPELPCDRAGGVWQGAGTNCSTDPCPQPATGACCLADQTCIIDWVGGCLEQGGSYRGDGTDCATVPACPRLIETVFGGQVLTVNPGIGSYFNVTAVDPAGIVIDRFDIDSRAIAGTPVTAHVYVRPGTYLLSETTPLDWTLLGEVETISAGTGNPTPVAIGGLQIAAGETWGLRVGLTSSGGIHTSTNANTQPFHADDHIELEMGRAQLDLFSGTLLGSPPNDLRGWNGRVWYTIGAEVTTGACCLPVGSCDTFTEDFCVGTGGTYHGDNTDCGTTPPGGCPQPVTGACCFTDGSCLVVWEPGCLEQAGLYQGNGSDCASSDCPLSLTTTFGGTLNANSANAGVFFDVTALHPGGIVIEGFQINSRAVVGTQINTFVHTTPNTYVGVESDASAWTLIGYMDTISAGDNEPTVIPIGNIPVAMGETIGVRLGITSGGLRYSSAATTTAIHSDANVQVELGRAQNNLFGNLLAANPAGWNGTLFYSIAGDFCYANCDGSTVQPILNVDDFTCFINEFAAASELPHEQQISHYANCDGSTISPVLNVDDFTCFINEFAAGCP